MVVAAAPPLDIANGELLTEQKGHQPANDGKRNLEQLGRHGSLFMHPSVRDCKSHSDGETYKYVAIRGSWPTFADGTGRPALEPYNPVRGVIVGAGPRS